MRWPYSQGSLNLLRKGMLLERFLRLFPMVGSKVPLYTSQAWPIDKIRTHLEKFGGGSVDLTKGDDGLAVLLLNHPEKKNAFTGKMMVELEKAVDDLKIWTEGKGVLVRGAGKCFCSGGDLNFVRQISTPEEGFMMSTFMHDVLNKFERLPLVSVALIEGAGALGGGAELSLACDFRLMTENCQGVGFVHGKMGILPAWGGTSRLVGRVGCARALEILTTAEVMGPQECLNRGLVDEVLACEVSDPQVFARDWLARRTRFDAELTRAIKVTVTAVKDDPKNCDVEKRIFAPFWGGRLNREALRKNLKHRPEPNHGQRELRK